jgi:hypothetical protein
LAWHEKPNADHDHHNKRSYSNKRELLVFRHGAFSTVAPEQATDVGSRA